MLLCSYPLLNQVYAPGFLELLLSMNACMRMCVCVFVYVSAPGAINNLWRDVVRYRSHMIGSNQFYGFYMAAIVNIISGRDLSIHKHRGN